MKFLYRKDVFAAIYKSDDLIDNLNIKINKERERIKYLSCLINNFDEDILPFPNGILKNSLMLKQLVYPYINMENILDKYRCSFDKLCDNEDKSNVKIIPNDIGLILEDFIKFCVELKKGKKFGVGEFHIQKYLESRKFE